MDTVDSPVVRIGKVAAFLFFIAIVVGIGIFFYSFTFDNKMANEDDPILDFRPKPDNPDSILIWINQRSDFNESFWADKLEDFMEEYTNESNWDGDGILCSFANGLSASNDSDSHCIVAVDNIEELLMEDDNNFGYTDNDNGTQPSVLLILKNMENWEPEPYTVEDLNAIKDLKMPLHLRDKIRQLDRGTEMDQRRLDTIWFSCEGINPGDIESIGPIRFYAPGMDDQDFPGIPTYYFPYVNQTGYQTPFVIAQFQDLREGTLVGVECSAWAKNIGPYDSKNKKHKGFVTVEFELILDDD